MSLTKYDVGGQIGYTWQVDVGIGTTSFAANSMPHWINDKLLACGVLLTSKEKIRVVLVVQQ